MTLIYLKLGGLGENSSNPMILWVTGPRYQDLLNGKMTHTAMGHGDSQYDWSSERLSISAVKTFC